MAHTPQLDNDTFLDMAAFLVRDNDRLARYAAQVENMPKMHAKYQGQIEGQRNALAMISGFLGYGTTDELIRHVRVVRPSIASIGRTTTVHEAEAARVPTEAAQVARVLAADARAAWPVDHAEGE